jgi:hypothetical protein
MGNLTEHHRTARGLDAGAVHAKISKWEGSRMSEGYEEPDNQRTPENGEVHDITGVADASSCTPPCGVSVRKREANRRNAQRSTGPRTPEGKAKVRWNALTHGLLAKAIVVNTGTNSEDEGELQRLLATLIEELQPVGMLEHLYVERIAAAYWRLQRAARAEAAVRGRESTRGPRVVILRPPPPEEDIRDDEDEYFASEEFKQEVAAAERARAERFAQTREVNSPAPEGLTLETIMRYETRYSRELDRAMDRLIELQQQRRKEAARQIQDFAKQTHRAG